MYAEINENKKIVAFHEEDGTKRIKISKENWSSVLESTDTAYIKNEKVVFEKKKRSKQEIEYALMSLCDSKHLEIETSVLNYKATKKQIERYKDKYERAKENEFDDATNKIIIKKFREAQNSIHKFVDVIEKFRSAVDDLIQNKELDKAERAIVAMRALSVTATKEDIDKLLKNL